MAKVTSGRRVTVPKALAQRFGIEPGNEVEWEAVSDGIRMVLRRVKARGDATTRLKLFDQATVRQRERDKWARAASARSRGWTRAQVYKRHRGKAPDP